MIVGATGAGAPHTRQTLGWGLNGGLAVAKDWFVVRANLNYINTYARALTNRNNFASLSLHFGVRF